MQVLTTTEIKRDIEVLIFFKFAHACLILYILCCLLPLIPINVLSGYCCASLSLVAALDV